VLRSAVFVFVPSEEAPRCVKESTPLSGCRMCTDGALFDTESRGLYRTQMIAHRAIEWKGYAAGKKIGLELLWRNPPIFLGRYVDILLNACIIVVY